MPSCVPGRTHDLPFRVTEQDDLPIGKWLVNDARGDRLIEILGLTTTGIRSGKFLGVDGTRRDPVLPPPAASRSRRHGRRANEY
jgi:hypothetical protein